MIMMITDQTCLPDWDVESDKERPRTSIPAGKKVFLHVKSNFERSSLP